MTKKYPYHLCKLDWEASVGHKGWGDMITWSQIFDGRNLEISSATTKAKSREPAAYSQALIQNKLDRQRIKIQRVRQADSQTAEVDGVSS